MKTLIYILFFSTLYSCNDSIDFVDPLNKSEKSGLKSQIAVLDQGFISEIHEKLFKISKQSINISNSDVIREIPLYKEAYNLFQKKLENFPLLFDFIIYDKRCKNEINSLSSVLLWDIADNNFSSITKELRGQDKITDMGLIKSLLAYYDSQDN
jgi:hypothetical protein